MSDLNSCNFTGRLGRDPEMRFTSSGSPVTNLVMAVQTGEESVMWLDVAVWGSQAEACNKYLAKGRRVAVSGKLIQDSWTTEDGSRRTKHRLTAYNVVFLGSPTESRGDNDGDSDKQYSGMADVRPDGGIDDSSLADEFPL